MLVFLLFCVCIRANCKLFTVTINSNIYPGLVQCTCTEHYHSVFYTICCDRLSALVHIFSLSLSVLGAETWKWAPPISSHYPILWWIVCVAFSGISRNNFSIFVMLYFSRILLPTFSTLFEFVHSLCPFQPHILDGFADDASCARHLNIQQPI